MSFPQKLPHKPRRLLQAREGFALFGGLLLAAALVGCSWQHPREPAAANSPAPSEAMTMTGVSTQPPKKNTVTSADAPVHQPKPIQPPPVQTFPWFQSHPFAVAKSTLAYGWTAEDGTDTNVIRRLAHNDLEYRRMVIENNAIFARQLVYHIIPFMVQAEQAVQSGQSLRQITLPGLDGQEFQAVVTRTELKAGGSRGQIYAQLPGDPNSMVTVAFINDREAFTMASPLNQIYLLGEAREPGEIVVKSINPAIYGKPMN